MKEKEKKSRTQKSVPTAVQPSAVEPDNSKPAPKTTRKKASSSIGMPVNGAEPKKKTVRKKSTPTISGVKASHEEIARLAHRYWAERGGQHGHHEEDWLRAERELLGKAS